MNTQIKLSKKLAGNRLMISKCGKYITNGHWLVRKDLVSFDSRWIDADSHKPRADQVIPKNVEYTPVTHLTVRPDSDQIPLVTFLISEGKKPVAVNTMYMDFFMKLADERMLKIGTDGPFSPVTISDNDGTFLAVVMPFCDKDTLPALAKTLALVNLDKL